MTEHDLPTRLRHEVTGSEPPFTTSPFDWRAAAIEVARRRRRRRTVAASTAAVVAVIAAVAVPAVVFNKHTSATTVAAAPVPPPARELLDDFDPATFPNLVDGEVRAAVGDALPADVTGRIEPTSDGTRLRPEDYAYTDAWTARYDINRIDRLDVNLRQDKSANEGAARKYCEQALATSQVERCTVDKTNGVSITTVTKNRLTSEGLAPVRAQDGPDTWWFTRSVYNRRDYGFSVRAAESVKATSLGEADTTWTIPESGLLRVATSSRLVYKVPTGPGPLDCNNTTMLIPNNEDDYAEVVCERDLN